jgi:hypothetical protein
MNLKALLPGNLHTREAARERVRYKNGRDEGNVQPAACEQQWRMDADELTAW